MFPQSLSLVLCHPHSQILCYSFGDGVLNCEDILRLFVKLFRPNQTPVLCVMKPHGDAYSVAEFLHGSIEHSLSLQLTPGRDSVLLKAGVSTHSAEGAHRDLSELAQSHD